MISVIRKKNNYNEYLGRGWNLENTTKYVIDINGKEVEVGHFIHYKKTGSTVEFVKEVIELPSSRGCPIKCLFCASSNISGYIALTTDELLELFDYFYNSNVEKDHYVLVTMTGIGDYALCYKYVNEAIMKINLRIPGIHFTVSSCIWSNEAIDAVLELNKLVDIRSINITYISHNTANISKLINGVHNYKYDIYNTVSRFQNMKLNNLRVNYLMIKHINDSAEDFKAFSDVFSPLKDGVVVRISKLNNTNASRNAGLVPPSIQSMENCQQYLIKQGYRAYLFYSFKDDQMNCGQLLTEQ